MNDLLSIPEVRALEGPASLIRIPNQIDIPVTERVLGLIDTPEFQRLSRISQLGLVSSVYPAAHHNRFEHSLGVYRMTLLFLRQLAYCDRFCATVSVHDAEVLIVSALLHDLGHWPFCHPIEDMQLESVQSHEDYAQNYLTGTSLRQSLNENWNIQPDEVLKLLNRNRDTKVTSLLSSILSGPIDVDKMDYLYRDSLHAGVPYGQNFDSTRLIRSLCLNAEGDKLAITHKGRTAAELMVISRYTMFSEVYWHHAVRSATSMFQRAFFEWQREHGAETNFPNRLGELFGSDEPTMIRLMQQSARSPLTKTLLEMLFGPSRKIYKRVTHYNCLENPEIYQTLAHRSYPWLVACGDRLVELASEASGTKLSPGQILIDAPPVGLEVQFDIDVFYESSGRYRKLGEVSPLVNTLAARQFDDHVKQVRVFAAPAIAKSIKELDVDGLLTRAIGSTAATG